MKKNVMKSLAVMLAFSMLAGCTFTTSGNNQGLDDPSGAADPVITEADTNETDTSETNKPSDADNETDNQENTENEQQPEVKILPDKIDADHEVRQDHAAMDVTVTATDKDEKTLWSKVFEDINIGQYDTYTEIGLKNDAYYIAVNGILYCLNIYNGEELWSYGDEKGNGVGCSCVYDFDENGTIYIAGYECPDLVVIDKDGKELQRYDSFTNKDEVKNFFWKSGLYYEDGKARYTFYNNAKCIVADPETGIAKEEEFDDNVLIEKIDRKWELLHYCSDKDMEIQYAKELDGECTFSVSDDFVMEFHFSDGDEKYDCEYVYCVLRPVDLYEGINDSYYGVWCLEGIADKNNKFAFQESDPDTLDLIWFRFDDNGDPVGMTSFEFMDAEVLKYHQDRLEQNQ
ncbi:MAG: hypothetical protein K5776_05980 [Lachnospiraceae bacterium]|nr:hypothetical protein [Lachnospiraceae bacterium]